MGTHHCDINNIKQYTIKTTERAKMLGRKGGLSRSPKKSESAKVRWWKERLRNNILTSDDMNWMMQQVTDPNAMSIKLLNDIDQISRMPEVAQDAELKMKVVNLYNQAMRTMHGDKIKLQSMNININIEAQKQAEAEIEEYLSKI